MAFERGDTKKRLEIVGKAKGTGTTVWFKPDTEIFTETRFDYGTIANRLRELAFLNKGLTITLKDERKGQQREETFHYKDRKSTRLNSSHLVISYAVFCLKKKN